MSFFLFVMRGRFSSEGARRPGSFAIQHSTTLTARPPIAVSLYLWDMSLPVSRMVTITSSSETRCEPSPHNAIFAALMAFAAAIAFRSIHGHLHQPPDRITRQPQVVFHRDLRSVLHLTRRTAHHLSQTSSSHRRRRTHLALAPHLSPGNGRLLLVQHPTAPAASRNFTTTSSRSSWLALSIPGA
jgi:hypothetical protein